MTPDQFLANATPASDGSGCLIWSGSKDRKGYGSVRWEGRTRLAHRVAWLLAHGSWPTDCALHACDNPSCVNPEHLFSGSVLDNNADCLAKGRNARGEQNGHAKLTNKQVSEIRRRLAGAPRGMVTQLAWEYGVAQSAISFIKLRQRWLAAEPLPPVGAHLPNTFPAHWDPA